MECIVNIKKWMTSNFLLLNSEKKTEGIISGPKTPTSNNLEHCLTLDDCSLAEMLINVFMTSRLDYCNALLGGCSARLINKLQIVKNAAARVLTRTRKYDHISPVLSTLHWLPIKHCIDFKIL